MTGPSDLKKLININLRRLQKLKEQEAYTGVDTRPHIILEIEDIEARLAELQQELVTLDNAAMAATDSEMDEFTNFDKFFEGMAKIETELKQLKDRLEKLDSQGNSAPTQNVRIKGSNNQVNVAGRDIHN